MNIDNYYMEQALKLAESGLGQTAPNPSVGCVIVKNDAIISTARTQNGGRPHAEHIAIDNAREDLTGASIYITLEPCCVSSHAKVACVEKIIKAKLGKVVISAIDPNPAISGRSIGILQKAGLEVKTGVLEEKCEELIKGFKKRILTNIPLVTLKLAMSIDGKIALKNGKSKWITTEKQRLLGHKLRARNDAILTGIGTVIADDPLLTCRLPGIKHNPVRIILDTDFKIPEHSQIIKTSTDIRTIIFTAKEVNNPYKNIEIIKIKGVKSGLCLSEVLKKIGDLGINNLLVESGQRVNTSFIKEKLVDKVVVFQANKFIGGDGLNAIGDLNYFELTECTKLNVSLIGE